MSPAKDRVFNFQTSAHADIGQDIPADLKEEMVKGKPAQTEGFRLPRLDTLQEMVDPYYLHTISLTELYETAYTPRANIVDDFLSAGTYLFVGGPKVGKSFFMAQLGYHVSTGLPLWERIVHPCTVLYLALEDTLVRLQKRLSTMFGVNSVDDFHIATQAKTLHGGLDYQLTSFIKKHPNTRLVIVDTLQKVREFGGESYSYASDYEIVTRLKQFSERFNVCILAVHHTRKQSAEDCFDMISGTNGLLGAADGAYLMHKIKRTDKNAIIEIVGRDQADQRLHLSFHQERLVWELTKSETELWKEPPNPLLEAVAALLSSNAPEWSGTATELLTQLDGLDIQPNVLTRRLNVSAERLWNEYGIRLVTQRTHSGRMVTLTLDEDGRDHRDDDVDILDSAEPTNIPSQST